MHLPHLALLALLASLVTTAPIASPSSSPRPNPLITIHSPHTLTPHTHPKYSPPTVSAPDAAIGVRDAAAFQCPSGCPVGKRDSGPVGPAYKRDAVPAEYTTPDRRDASAGTTGPVGKREAGPEYESPVGINRREAFDTPVGAPVGKREAGPEYESPVGINKREAFDTPVGAPVGKREADAEA
ncbi:hypothetical protein MMC27_002233 [Xylographa pallens]|nr:hypothetical protein [Xylographa pallens]